MRASPTYSAFHEAETDPIFPLVRRSLIVPSAQARRRPHVPAPLIVDKHKLVRLVRAVREVPPTVPPIVRSLTMLVRESRAAERRRSRERTWLKRITVVALVGAAMVLGTRPATSAFVHQCATHAWFAGAR